MTNKASSPITGPAGSFSQKQQIEAARRNLEGRVSGLENATGADLPGLVMIPLLGALLAAGTPLAKFTTGTTPGVTVDNAKAVGVRWHAGTLTTIWTEVDVPLDLDPTYPVVVKFLVSKSGSTGTDVVSITLAAYAQTVGALEDAGSNLGGVTPALSSGQAALPAKTITMLQTAIYLPPTPPAHLSLSITPSGTLAADDLVLNGAWLEYVRRPAVARVQVDLRNALLAAGTPLAAFADSASSAPGITLNNSKSVGPRWNDASTQVPIWGSFVVPGDMDVTKPATLVVLCDKSGATSGDATTFTVTMYAQVPGALEDAGSNLGGTTSAITGTATAKTVQKSAYGIAPNTFPASPAGVSFSIQPTNGLLGTDDIIVTGAWIEYFRSSGNAPIATVDIKSALLADGTPMAAWASTSGASSSPGVTLENSKSVGVKWNNNAAQAAVWSYFDIPDNFDTTQPIVVNLLAMKSGATVTDATTFDVGIFEQTPGALEDATPAGTSGLGLGGTTSAMAATAAAKTVQQVSYTIPANTITAAPGRLSISMKPTNGSLGTDNVLVSACWLSYLPKVS